MDRKFTYKMLEFNRVLELVSKEAQTIVAKDEINNLEALSDVSKIKTLLDITDEALKIITYSDTIVFSGKIDIESYIKLVEVDGFLKADELLDVLNHIEVIKRLLNYSKEIDIENLDYFNSLINKLTKLDELETELTRCIDINGNIRDSASFEIRKCRKSISSKENEVKNKMSTIMNSKKNMLSENIITVRNNRQVLAVKSEYKHIFGGLIHDESISGQTVYIEPDQCVPLNNSIVELNSKLKNEIEKILRYISSFIKNRTSEIRTNIYVIKQVDIMLAKARFAKKYDCSRAQISENRNMKLLNARHPLIDRIEVVANDIILNDQTSMIITGANTGGKTITLKTVGLFALMTQVGLFITASDKSKIPIFDKIFTQMGDNQSLENNLSTFSSHILELKYILENSTSNSLVLLDEIGNGTNPSEGSALAIAILEELHKRNATVFATTHYNELKEYAEANDYVVPASVKFDTKTLTPTYKLMLNTSGLSYALMISERLGLSKDVVDNASLILEENIDQSVNLIDKVNEQKLMLDDLEEKLAKEIEDVEKLKLSLSKKQDEVVESSKKIVARAKAEANTIIEDAINKSNSLINKLSKTNKHHELLETKKKLEDEKFKELELKKKSEVKIEIGDEVLVLPFESKAKVLKQVNPNEYEVLMGSIKSVVKKENLIFNYRSKNTIKKHTTSTVVNKSINTSLDLRGLRVYEAEEALDSYLDKAKLSSLNQVTIIHGYGTGAVRKMVIDVLKRRNIEFRSGGAGEGGSGATVVIFK